MARLERLPVEILEGIFEHIWNDEDRVWYRHGSHAREDPNPKPREHALARVSPRIKHSLLAWHYRVWTFYYYNTEVNIPTGSDFLSWLRTLKYSEEEIMEPEPITAARIHKLTLNLYAPEMYELFTSEANSWRACRHILSRLGLVDLTIRTVDGACAFSCTAGEKKTAGPHPIPMNDDCSIPRHFQYDARWVVKAVLESTKNYLDPSNIHFDCHGVGAKKVRGLSWETLHSSTWGWHRCNTNVCDHTSARSRAWKPSDGDILKKKCRSNVILEYSDRSEWDMSQKEAFKHMTCMKDDNDEKMEQAEGLLYGGDDDGSQPYMVPLTPTGGRSDPPEFLMDDHPLITW